jgi:hypothetical protein
MKNFFHLLGLTVINSIVVFTPYGAKLAHKDFKACFGLKPYTGGKKGASD